MPKPNRWGSDLTRLHQSTPRQKLPEKSFLYKPRGGRNAIRLSHLEKVETILCQKFLTRIFLKVLCYSGGDHKIFLSGVSTLEPKGNLDKDVWISTGSAWMPEHLTSIDMNMGHVHIENLVDISLLRMHASLSEGLKEAVSIGALTNPDIYSSLLNKEVPLGIGIFFKVPKHVSKETPFDVHTDTDIHLIGLNR